MIDDIERGTSQITRVRYFLSARKKPVFKPRLAHCLEKAIWSSFILFVCVVFLQAVNVLDIEPQNGPALGKVKGRGVWSLLPQGSWMGTKDTPPPSMWCSKQALPQAPLPWQTSPPSFTLFCMVHSMRYMLLTPGQCWQLAVAGNQMMEL